MKRGQNINITTIIILILAILVLLLLVISFTGGWTTLWKRITGQQQEAGVLEKGAAIQSCKLIYSLYKTGQVVDKKALCIDKKNVAGMGEVTCKQLFEQINDPEINLTEVREFCE